MNRTLPFFEAAHFALDEILQVIEPLVHVVEAVIEALFLFVEALIEALAHFSEACVHVSSQVTDAGIVKQDADQNRQAYQQGWSPSGHCAVHGYRNYSSFQRLAYNLSSLHAYPGKVFPGSGRPLRSP